MCFFRRAPTWSVAQTHTHAWRAQIVVTDAGVAVKYYLAQSFKGETIKREGLKKKKTRQSKVRLADSVEALGCQILPVFYNVFKHVCSFNVNKMFY